MSKEIIFYFPIRGHIESVDYEYFFEDFDGAELYTIFKEEINLAVKKQCFEDMLFYYDDTPTKEKLSSMYWSIAEANNTLYGCVKVEIKEDLTQEDIQEIKDFIEGQNSDGLGEGFEQHEIKQLQMTGYLYVHFWDSTDEYYVYTEQEFKENILRGQE